MLRRRVIVSQLPTICCSRSGGGRCGSTPEACRRRPLAVTAGGAGKCRRFGCDFGGGAIVMVVGGGGVLVSVGELVGDEGLESLQILVVQLNVIVTSSLDK